MGDKLGKSILGGASSAVASTAAAVVTGAAAFVVALVVGAVIFLLMLAVGVFVSALLSLIGLMINPIIGLILGLLVLLVGVIVALNVFILTQLRVSRILDSWGLRNYYRELTTLLAVVTVAVLVSVAAWAAKDLLLLLNDPPSPRQKYVPQEEKERQEMMKRQEEMERLEARQAAELQNMAAGLVTLLALFGCVLAPKIIRDTVGREGDSFRAVFLGPYPDRLEQNGDVAGLVEALRHPEREVRFAAARALGNLRDERAAPALQEAASDSRWNVRYQAAAALVKIGREDALMILVDGLLSASADAAKFALEAVRTIPQDATGKVEARLVEVGKNDASESKRKAAEEALKKLGETAR